ncbi:hypothetical protein ACLB2K_042151 [Fragaria x ananassa]
MSLDRSLLGTTGSTCSSRPLLCVTSSEGLDPDAPLAASCFANSEGFDPDVVLVAPCFTIVSSEVSIELCSETDCHELPFSKASRAALALPLC